jgi:two-component system, OmpR family, phosphate regulon sensor histidine kinase PhoR
MSPDNIPPGVSTTAHVLSSGGSGPKETTHFPWYSSLRFRIAIPFAGLMMLVFLILYLVLTEGVDRMYVNRLSDEMASQARVAAYSVSEARLGGRTQADISHIIDEFGGVGHGRYTLISASGQVLADSRADSSTMDNHNHRPEVIEARRDGVGTDRRKSGTLGEQYLYVAVMVPGGEESVLRMAVPVAEIDEAVGNIGHFLLISLISTLALTLAAAWIIAGRLSQMLDDLKVQANAVAAGDYSARVEPTDVREIAVVGQAFNSMAARLNEVIDEQKRMSIRLEAVMAGLADGVVLTDGEGIVLRMNDAAQAMLDTAEDAAYGRPFVQVSRDHELWLVLRDAFAGKKNPSATVVHGLERASLLMTARRIEDDGGNMGLVVLRDVTELRRLETVRREFVANVSHELRTPLTSIRALVETLEAGAIEEEEIAMDFLGRIVGEVDRLNALVEDLLDFARLEAGRAQLKLEKVDVGEAVRIGADRLRPQMERARLDLHIEVAEGLPELDIDVARIEQVIVNLVHNAIKFTPAGGSITIRVSQEKNNIVVQVQDTGVGIAPEEQARLFERFYKSDRARRSEGTGLGLAIAKNIVLSHGGLISVESTQGEGATFTFTLPIRRKKALKRARKHALGLI